MKLKSQRACMRTIFALAATLLVAAGSNPDRLHSEAAFASM